MVFVCGASHAGDVGGFWTYAAEQTRRKFDLPKSEAPEPPFRRFRSTEELQYAVLSGALAIQESMQLDRMVNTDRDRGERKIAFADISAVTAGSFGVRASKISVTRGRPPTMSLEPVASRG